MNDLNNFKAYCLENSENQSIVWNSAYPEPVVLLDNGVMWSQRNAGDRQLMLQNNKGSWAEHKKLPIMMCSTTHLILEHQLTSTRFELVKLCLHRACSFARQRGYVKPTQCRWPSADATK